MPTQFNVPGGYLEEMPSGARTIAGVPTSIAVFLGKAESGPLQQPVRVQDFSAFEAVFGPVMVRQELAVAVMQFFRNGGRDAFIVRVPDHPLASHWRAALAALDGVDIFNLLLLPGVTTRSLLSAAAEYCRRRRALLIMEMPSTKTTPEQVKKYLADGAVPVSPNAAVYFPWVQVVHPALPGGVRWCPPGGTIAGLMARTDANRGVWKAPAGTDATLAGVQDLRCRLDDFNNGVLNPLAVNCLRAFPGPRFAAWGARTTAGADTAASDWKYIPVRRVALFIEESLQRGLQWTVFEPNAEPLWAQIRLLTGAFLNELFRHGAFAGTTATTAYLVQCDATTTTPDDLRQGRVNLQVGFAPLKPAEFTILKLQLSAAASD